MPTRHQDGYIYRKKNRWYVRYYERVTQKDGSVSRIQISRSVAPVCHEYRTKGAVSPLLAEILKDINSNTVTVPSTLSLEPFVDDNYLPRSEEHTSELQS